MRSARAAAAAAACAALLAASSSAAAQSRTVAVTVDDLPVVSTRSDLATWQDVTTRLVAALRRNGVPATAFVIGERLARRGERDPARVALLDVWLDAGLELGNHSYSHDSLNETDLAAYEADVLRGDSAIRPVLAAHGRVPHWYRHPYLHTGRDTATRSAFEAFLDRHEYRVAPVTFDNSDWLFARAYDHSLDAGNTALADTIAATYLTYMDTVFGYYEAQSRELLGREPPQVLLMHANRLNADTFDRLAEVLRRRGYAFVPLAEAVRDPAYAHADGYTGAGGITWLHRWALTEGRRGAFFAGEPVVPEFVTTIAEGR